MIYTKFGNRSNLQCEERGGTPDTDFDFIATYPATRVAKTVPAEEVGEKHSHFFAGILTELDKKNRFICNAGSVVNRSLITLDYDDIPTDAETFKKAVHDALHPFAYYLYPTKSNTPENPCYRLVVKPERAYEEGYHIPLVRQLEESIGIKTGDSTGNNTWAHTNGLPVYIGMSKAEYLELCKWNDGEAYPITVAPEPIQPKTQRIMDANAEPLDKDMAYKAMENYIRKDIANLTTGDRGVRYGNFNSALMVIVKSVQTGEISIEDGESFAEMLARGNPEWIDDNVKKLHHNLKTNVRKEQTFMQKFDYYGEVRNLDSTLTEYAQETGLADWKENLIRNKREPYNVIRNIKNLELMILHDENLKDILMYNEFSQVVEKSKMFPWEQSYNQQLTDDDLGEMKIYLSKKYGVEYGKENLLDVTLSVAKRSSFHPIKSMIERTPWDGVKRAETMFIDYLGTDDNEYMRLVAKKWLVGAISRIYTPGIRFEIVPVVTGKQGAGKSTLASKLGGEFFSDDLKDMKSKDSKEFLLGSWIIELGELSAMRKSETEEIKSFISTRKDRYRPSYGRITNNYPRTCVFIATSNDNHYLKDMTGARRFFPVPVDAHERKKDVFTMDANTVQQIWAEAFTFYNAGETCYFSKEEEATLAEPYRDDATEEDMMKTDVLEYLNILIPDNWNSFRLSEKRSYIQSVMENIPVANYGTNERERITVKEILSELLQLDPSKYNHNNTDAKKVNTIMNNLPEWEYTRWREHGKQIRGYERKV